MTKEDEAVISELEKQIGDLTESLAKAVESSKTASAEIQKQLDAAKEALAKAEAEKATLVLKAGMTDEEKEHCKDKSSEDTAAFMSKSPEERKKAMAKNRDNDEVLSVEGQEIRKSVVGDSQFAIIKAQAARIKKNEDDIAKERDSRELAVLSKRADDEYKHVPGTTEERANMLKALGAMDEPLRKSFEAVLTQSEKLAAAAFGKVGHNGNEDEIEKRSKKNGLSAFEKKVDEIHKRDKGTRAEAMTKARTEYPDEFKAYQDAN